MLFLCPFPHILHPDIPKQNLSPHPHVSLASNSPNRLLRLPSPSPSQLSPTRSTRGPVPCPSLLHAHLSHAYHSLIASQPSSNPKVSESSSLPWRYADLRVSCLHFCPSSPLRLSLVSVSGDETTGLSKTGDCTT